MASPQSAAPRRHNRGFSFSGKSDKSHRSSSSKIKIDLTETSEERHRRRISSKADPMLAMSEAQPIAVALEKSTLGSLRSIQHKDQFGNIIADPDFSNPTRPRFERPLDTIRSFEAAMYGPSSSSRPVSYARTEESNSAFENSRRASYYAEQNRGNGYSIRGYNEQPAYYNGRETYSRPDSYVEGYGSQPQDNYYPYNDQGSRRPRRNPRINSGQGMYNYHRPDGYAHNPYYKSYDNIAAASGSGSGSNTEPGGTSTDPSSVNSSMDQLQQHLQQRPTGNYGPQGFNAGQNFNGNSSRPPQPPAHNFGRVPVPDPNNGGPVGGPQAAAAALNRRGTLRKSTNLSNAGEKSEKRKSWFKRRFSKD